jgi:DNA topoisomerase-6 subunit A
MDDIDKFGLKNFTIKATEADIKRAKELLNYEWFKDQRWQSLIKSMIERKIKAELEALSARGIRFISETYIPTKIKNQEFLE